MAGQGPSANVRDVTTLEKAQWALAAYREEIQQGLIEAQAEVARFTNWLEQQRPQELAAQMQRQRDLENAKADLTRAEMTQSNMGTSADTERKRVQRARRKSKTYSVNEKHSRDGAIDWNKSDLCSLQQPVNWPSNWIPSSPRWKPTSKTAVMPWLHICTGTEVTFK